jgi:DNA topoisomerase-1
MSKKYAKTTTSLVIVESPAKCKKIEEYLGPGYKCIATYGHLRELNSLKNIDIESNFSPTYTIIDISIKKKQIEILKKAIKSADEVILATDDDREGEGIAWHICELFKLPLTTKRIIFNEITETAIREAVQNPKIINMDLVYAQQARQILDILVGFKITPILWKCITRPKGKENSLSAGRCQTPALKIIYDNYKEIKEVNQKKIYNTIGYFTNSNLPFELNKCFETEDEMTDFLEGSLDFQHIYTCEKPVKVIRTPPEPFTTSRIQQVASNDLHYSPKETMKICQSLYEGGFITYMRTDSKTYSGEFIDIVKTFIAVNYGKNGEYINKNITSLINGYKKEETDKEKKKKKENIITQDAHEAIRPTNISLNELPENFDSKEKRMYKLIWENTLQSCMADATFNSITSNITGYQETKFKYKCEKIEFPGWTIVSTKSKKEEKNEYEYLQMIKQNDKINYKKFCSKVTLKGSKNHYTEARLVQILEEKGIGRPSTFSAIVDKIQERGYVKKEDIKGVEIICNDYELENGEIFEIESKREFGNEKNKLVIQPLGIIVIDFLENHFDELFEYNYTSKMEELLDKISKGQDIWYNICNDCNKVIDFYIDKMGTQGKLEIKLDENNTYLVGNYGPVIKCIEEKDGKKEVTFKKIKKDINISEIENNKYSLEEIIEEKKIPNSYILGQYEGKDVILKKGKFGLYISWGKNTKNLKDLGNRPIENITFDEIKEYLEEGSNIIRVISDDISIRKGPKGDYIFYKNKKMKKPKFYDIKKFTIETNEDYKICKIDILKSWIKEQT